MALAPITRRSLADEVAAQLFERIVDGEIAAGEALPSERALAATLGVSRPAVREGLQRLATAGLVDIRQGDRTTATDYRRTAGFDLLPRLLLRGTTIDLDVAADVFAARADLGPVVAAAAARGRTDADLARLDRALADLAGIDTDADPEGRNRAALDLWDAVVDASHNVAYRLLFNAFRATYEPVLDLLTIVLDREVRATDRYAALVDAVRAGDPDVARTAADAVLAEGTAAGALALSGLAAARASTPAAPDPAAAIAARLALTPADRED